MKSILFVCLGNICRSCTAEEIFRVKATQAGKVEQFDIDSAGLINYHEGELPDERMRRTAARYGYQLVHRSRPVCTADFERFDYIVAMDHKNHEKLERMAPTPPILIMVRHVILNLWSSCWKKLVTNYFDKFQWKTNFHLHRVSCL